MVRCFSDTVRFGTARPTSIKTPSRDSERRRVEGSEARNDLTPPVPAITPFSDEDFDTLGNWLVRRAKGISDIVELEGFSDRDRHRAQYALAARVAAQGLGRQEPSGFKDLDELNRFVALVMSFYNSIVADFEATPSKFAPTFYQSNENGKSVLATWPMAGLCKPMYLGDLIFSLGSVGRFIGRSRSTSDLPAANSRC